MSLKIGNRVTEKDIRHWLNDHGFYGNSAKISQLELHAIKRPGWVQVYKFHLKVKSNGLPSATSEDNEVSADDWVELVGVVLDDERIRNEKLKTQVWLFDSSEQQVEKLESLSEDMLTCRTGQNGSLFGVAALLFLLVLIAALSSTVI